MNKVTNTQIFFVLLLNTRYIGKRYDRIYVEEKDLIGTLWKGIYIIEDSAILIIHTSTQQI